MNLKTKSHDHLRTISKKKKMFTVPSNQGNENRNNFRDFISPQSEWQSGQKIAGSPPKNVLEKRSPHSLFMMLGTGAATLEITVENSQKAKIKTTM